MKFVLRQFRFIHGVMILCAALLLTNSASAQSRVAADMYRVAGQSLAEAVKSDAFILLNIYDAPLDDSAKAIVDRNAKALTTFDAASQVPFGDWGYDPDDTTYAGKSPAHIDELADIVVLRARIRAANGQYAEAFDDCYNIANLARRFSMQPSLMRQVLQDKLFDKAIAAAGLLLSDAPKEQAQKFVDRLDELRAPADPIDATLAQKQAYIWFYRKVVGDADLRNKLDKALGSAGEVFGVKGEPIDVTDLIADPGVAEQVFADAESAFNKMIDAMKSPPDDRTDAVRNMFRLLHSSHPLVRGAAQMAEQSYQLSLIQPMKVELFRTAAKICAELPRPIDDAQARQRAGSYTYSRAPGGFELLGSVQGLDQPVIIRIGARPLRERPATAPSQRAN